MNVYNNKKAQKTIPEHLMHVEDINNLFGSISNNNSTPDDGIIDFFSDHPLVQLILSSLDTLSQSGKKIVFIWVPSHIGINGNGSADHAARHVADAENISENYIGPSIADRMKLDRRKAQGCQINSQTMETS
ncbi:hypothetical protein JTB14_011490 [Gonioctena quinquepunctata]|nr:hypothetical protein JTB14_011490 [Gonioctena quinquepunctata]